MLKNFWGMQCSLMSHDVGIYTFEAETKTGISWSWVPEATGSRAHHNFHFDVQGLGLRVPITNFKDAPHTAGAIRMLAARYKFTRANVSINIYVHICIMYIYTHVYI